MGMVVRVALAALVVVSPLAMASDPEGEFESIFGEQVKKVKATSSGEDDADLAARLLDAAKYAADVPPFQVVLCEKAYDLAMKDKSGYATAVEAMTLLAQIVPDKSEEAEGKVLRVREFQYRRARGDERKNAGKVFVDQLVVAAERRLATGRTGEAIELYRRASQIALAAKLDCRQEIADKLSSAQEQEKIHKEMLRLEGILKANPKNSTAARQLMMLWLVEEDNPARAQDFMDAAKADETIRNRLALAMKGPRDATEAEALAMGDWYKELTHKASSAAKLAMLVHAQTYYQRFMETYAAKDAQAVRVKIELTDVERQLAVLCKMAPKMPSTVEPLVIEGVGTGKVIIGATVDQITKVLGEPDQRSDSPHVWLQYRKTLGIDIIFPGGTAREIRFNSGFVGHLTKGPGIGTPLDEVLRTYGQPLREVHVGRSEGTFEDRTLYVLPSAWKIIYQQEGVLFWFDKEKKVSQFVVISPKEPGSAPPATLPAPPQPPDDEKIAAQLKQKVTLIQPYPGPYAGAPNERISVQYAVIEVLKQVGLRYNWNASRVNTSPTCRQWITPAIKDKTCAEALDAILGPVGLSYVVRDGLVVLVRR